MQDPTLNRNDNGSLYREPFYFDIFDLRYMLNLISTLTLTFVSEKKIIFCFDFYLIQFTVGDVTIVVHIVYSEKQGIDQHS